MRPYQYCSKEECKERQELGQISELEATLETCRLAQSKRVLDPRIAVRKYRRSAAGDNGARSIRSKEELSRTLNHLIQICATLRSTPDHPPVKSIDTIVGFVSDRLRACQSDATRLMSDPGTCVPSSWHARLIRVLVFLRYVYCGMCIADTAASKNDSARAIDHMRSTAYDAYWSTNPRNIQEDDEMLCLDAISRICIASKNSATNCAQSLGTSWNGILLEFSKLRRPGFVYPLWNLAAGIGSCVQREEYYTLWKSDHSFGKELPVLAKCILSGEVLLLWRYRTVQHYNRSFGKSESVTDMNRLLGIIESTEFGTGWSIEYANVFGVPVEEAENHDSNHVTKPTKTITMKLKQVAMPEFNDREINAETASMINKSDRRWIFGDDFDDTNDSPSGLSPKTICRILDFRDNPSHGADTMTDKPKNNSIDNTGNKQTSHTSTSLSRALAASRASDGGQRRKKK